MTPEETARNYDKVAEYWNEQHLTSQYGLKQIERALEYCDNKIDALDVGCGSGGRVTNRLIESGFSIKGIDVSSKMLALAQSQHPEIDFEQADICKWETTQTFDFIIAWDSIFHLPMANQEPVVSKLCKYLKPDGILIYTFGDDHGEIEDYSFRDDETGKQMGDLDNDLFGYGTIGINENIRVLNENNCKCMHLEIDQFPLKHVFVIAKKLS